MSYGFNSPQGFVPVEAQNGAPLTASLRTLPISAEYGQNLWTGDLVIYGTNAIGSAGYMVSLYDYVSGNAGPGGAAQCSAFPILGVFAGCSYRSETDITNPDAPMRDRWTAGTTTADAVPAVGYYIPINYEYGFSVQTGPTPATQAMVGKFTSISYELLGSGLVAGNTKSGQSKISVNMDQNSANAVPINTGVSTTSWNTFQITGLDYSQGIAGAGVPYGNVIIRVANTAIPSLTLYPTAGV